VYTSVATMASRVGVVVVVVVINRVLEWYSKTVDTHTHTSRSVTARRRKCIFDSNPVATIWSASCVGVVIVIVNTVLFVLQNIYRERESSVVWCHQKTSNRRFCYTHNRNLSWLLLLSRQSQSRSV
jgi:hypothetical protein